MVRRYWALAVVAIVLLAACGGSDDDDEASPTTAAGDTTETDSLLPGITDSTIKIGFIQGDASGREAVRSVGGDEEFEPTDEEKQIFALVDYVNSEGGIAGREVEPVIYAQHTGSARTRSGRAQDDQGACANFTEDEPVAVMGISTRTVTMTLLECAAAAGVPFVYGNPKLMPLPDSVFDQYGKSWYAPSWLTGTRYNEMLCDELHRQGFYEDATLAIMAYDDAWVREGVENTFKPCLESHGIEAAVEVYYPDFLESPWSNYVLQFQDAGVTHVVWNVVGLTGLPVAQFMAAAESQEYRPLYGGSSDMSISVVATTWQGPEPQLQNVRGVGVHPQLDTGHETPTSASGEVCQEVLVDAGLPPEDALGNEYCQGLFFVDTVLERADELTLSGFQAAVEDLGEEFVDPVTIDGATRFGPGRHDGASLVRDFEWSADEGRFVYTSPPRELP